MGAIEKAIAKFNVVTGPEATQGVPTEDVAQIPAIPGVPTKTVVKTDNPSVQLVKSGSLKSGAHSNKTFSLPHKAMEHEGLLDLTAPRNQMSEEYRAIKRPILAAIDSQDRTDFSAVNRNVIMVTSCISGEGKTFSAINLALSIALEKDRDVLLVDGDITNPSCGGRLGFDNDRPGLTELLQNKDRDPDDLIWQSDLPNFRFLPAGISHNHVTELLSSRNMSDLVDGLSRNYPERVIIIDSAPLLLTSEASIVADLAGQIVFVVGAESTTRGMVSDALRIVNDHSRVGFLLNKTRKAQNNIYGYGYGYGYGYANAG